MILNNHIISDDIDIESQDQLVKIRDKTIRELKDHCGKKSETRFTDLFLRLPPLRTIQPEVLEEIFFVGDIGKVQIVKIIPDLLKMNTTSVNTTQKENIQPKSTLLKHKNVNFINDE